MTAIDAEARTPLERVAAVLPVGKGPSDEDTVEVQAGDLGILYAIAIEFEDWANRHTGRYTDELCVLVGNLHGQDGHDWSEWRNEYIASGGDLWHERVCRRCGEIDYERVP